MEVWGCLGQFLAASGHQVGTQKLEPEVGTLWAISRLPQKPTFGAKMSPQRAILRPRWVAKWIPNCQEQECRMHAQMVERSAKNGDKSVDKL